MQRISARIPPLRWSKVEGACRGSAGGLEGVWRGSVSGLHLALTEEAQWHGVGVVMHGGGIGDELQRNHQVAVAGHQSLAVQQQACGGAR
eukprot:1179120-Prorocentrum_minimum.AAC.2